MLRPYRGTVKDHCLRPPLHEANASYDAGGMEDERESEDVLNTFRFPSNVFTSQFIAYGSHLSFRDCTEERDVCEYVHCCFYTSVYNEGIGNRPIRSVSGRHMFTIIETVITEAHYLE